MRKLLLSLLFLIVCAGNVIAQEAHVVYHPGDPIHILVTFKTPPEQIAGANFYFALSGHPEKTQELLLAQFTGSELKKVSGTEYEISGAIPQHIASGNFALIQILVDIKGVRKAYAQGSDFKELTITVLNPEHPEFPPIESVKVAGGN